MIVGLNINMVRLTPNPLYLTIPQENKLSQEYAEAAAGSRYLVLVDKLSQSLQDRCLLLLSLAALATSSMQ